MDFIELEAIAVETYQRHGFDPAVPVSTFKIARAVLNDPEPVTRPPTLLGFPSTVYRSGARTKIALRRSVPDDEALFYVGHELGHILLGKPQGGGAEIEGMCDYLGAALMAPRPAVMGLHRAFGWDLEAIGDVVCATQSWAALRLGETLRVPLAAVSPALVRVRGPEEHVWPEEETIRRWARGKPGPGLRKVAVTDRPRRIVLTAC